MLIRFLVDYRGQWTNEEFFTVGTIADLPERAAEMLVHDERAEYHSVVASTATVAEPEQEPEPEPTPKPRRKRTR